MINNERGLTLLEMIAATLLSAVILTVSAALYFSIRQVSSTSTQAGLDRNAISFAVDTLTEQIAESSQAVYYASAHELRYKDGSAYFAVVFNSSARTLTLYRFSNDGNRSNDDTQFRSSAISITANPTLYTQTEPLAGNITDFSCANITSVPLTNGDLFQMNFSFTIASHNRAGTAQAKTVSTTVKLLSDTTAK